MNWVSGDTSRAAHRGGSSESGVGGNEESNWEKFIRPKTAAERAKQDEPNELCLGMVAANKIREAEKAAVDAIHREAREAREKADYDRDQIALKEAQARQDALEARQRAEYIFNLWTVTNNDRAREGKPPLPFPEKLNG